MSDCEDARTIDIGVGLRACHYTYIETEKPTISWFEVLSDNYFCESGPSMDHLEKIRATYPVSLHCVGMSLGSTDPLNLNYLKQLQKLIDRIQPICVSDHLAWCSLQGQYFHELLPLPYTEEALKHVVLRIQQVQDFLQRQVLIENISNYLSYKHSTMKEWEFLEAVCEESDCLVLLDLNNLFVNSKNNGYEATDFLKNFNSKRIAQFHLAGFENRQTHLLDTHSASVHQKVWDLYSIALQNYGSVPTLIEWDNQIPTFPELLQEASYAKALMDQYGIAA